MARKQFVSSKKNAPSRAVSSKEAALHGRTGGIDTAADAHAPSGDDDMDDASDSDSGSNSPMSPASSNGSSLFTSDEPNERDDRIDTDVPTVAVEVVPSSVGRGKQLRFPTIVSRGKESRVFGDATRTNIRDDDDSDSNDSDDADRVDAADDAGSDSDSLLSLASDDDDENAVEKRQPAIELPAAAATVSSDAPLYPIKAARARKRHRPESNYFLHMSTFVRDCLLSVRDNAKNELEEGEDKEAHDAFRRKLSSNAVERVAWKESSPASADDDDDGVGAAAVHVMGGAVERKNKEKTARRRNELKEKRTDKKHKSKRQSLRHDAVENAPTVAAVETTGVAIKREVSFAPTAVAVAVVESQRIGAVNAAQQQQQQHQQQQPQPLKTEASTTTTTSSSSIKKERLALNGDGLKAPATVSFQTEASPAQTQTASLCLNCKRKLTPSDAASPTQQQHPLTSKKTVTIVEPSPPPTATREPQQPALLTSSLSSSSSSFLIPPAAAFTERDVPQLKLDASRLLEQARALKHEGNRRGAAAPGGTSAQIAQAKCYLRSSVKFFQHALKFADMKAAYKSAGDERHARSVSDYCVTTLTQTTTLVESTIRTLQAANAKRMVALGYKLAAVMHLAVYRLQHLKLFGLYSDLYTPGRSPDTRGGTPTPPSGTTATSDSSKEAVVKAHLLKEMEHTLRGFDMWRRYEACAVVVLPQIVEPATADLNVLFAALEHELGSS